MISGETRLEDEHPSVEVEGRGLTHLSWPFDLIGALLAVSNLILGSVAPRLLTETVHHGVEVAIWHVKEVVYIIVYLNISVQVYHLTVFYKLHVHRIIHVSSATSTPCPITTAVHVLR